MSKQAENETIPGVDPWALNAELLEALEAWDEWCEKQPAKIQFAALPMFNATKAAIAKARGE